MTKLPQTIIFMGRSGSGKGTQVELLRAHLEQQGYSDFIDLQTGSLFREFITGDTLTAHLAKEIYTEGGKDYDFLATYLIIDFFNKKYSGKESLFVDGNPRSKLEAELFTGILNFYKRFDESQFSKPIVIYVDVSHDWAIDKLKKRGRADDSMIENMERKMSWFDTETIPAVEYLKQDPRYKFIHVNGEQSIEEVHQEIVSRL